MRTPEFQAFSLEDDPGGLWIGEEDGRLVGSAFAWVCGDFWFLAELFVSPDLQAKGIGNQLLRRALDHANAKGARNRALITFTFNRTSQTLYIRHGIYPRCPVYMFGASREALRVPESRYRTERVSGTRAHLLQLSAIDISALGFSREKHHRFLCGDATMSGYLLLLLTGALGTRM